MISHNGCVFGPNMFNDVTVDAEPPNSPPDKPTPTGPYDWYVTVGNPPELRWNRGSDPNGDAVNECLVRIEGAPSPWESGWITGTSVTPSGLGYYNYGWKVKCRDNRGAESDWSDTWHFSLASPDVHINDVHFEPASPSAPYSVKIHACTDGRAGLGIAMRVSVNDATDGSANGNWHIIKELGVPCFNDIDAPVWYTLEYGDGVHRVRTEAFPQDPNVWTGGDTRDDYYTLQRRRPPSPQQLGPSASDNPFVWLNNATVEFRWNESIRASGYRLIVSPNPNPDLDPSPLVSVNLPPGSISYSADLGGDYPRLYWFIDASNELGDTASTAPFGIDSVSPTSTVSPLPTAVPDTTFQVAWDGSDDSSGVRAYDVQVRDGTRGDWVDWLANTTSKTALFQGQAGHTYYFRSRAADNANNYEPYVDGDGDTYTMIDRNLANQATWWNAAYGFKRNVMVLNNDPGTLQVGHPVRLHFDSTTSPTAQTIYDASQSPIKGDDVRVVYQDQTELDRFVANFAPGNVEIYFRTQASIALGQTGTYQLYYSNATPGAPPGNINTVLYPGVDANTVGVWHTFECQGSSVSDSSGNGNNGTKGSDVTWTLNAPMGCALHMPDFSSNGDEGVVIPASPSLAVNAFTFEAVAKRTWQGTLAAQGESGGARERWIIRADDSKLDFGVWSQGGSSSVVFDNYFVKDEWHHYAVTFDGGTTVKAYRDGGLFGVKNLPVSGITPGSAFFRIGAAMGGPNIGVNRIGADVQDVRLSNIVRSSFPYAGYALISQPPSLAAGDESARPAAQGTPELAVQSVSTYTMDTGEQLVAAVVSNIGNGDSANGFYIDLYDGHQPTGPGDLEGSVKFWVADPIPAGADVVLTTAVPPPMGPMMLAASSTAVEETTETLYVQADSTGSVIESDKTDNISPPIAVCFASPDSFEPDGDAATAKLVEVNGLAVTHNADIPEDEDWVSFSAEAGKAYDIRTANLAPSADTVLYLYDADATTLLASNDDSNGSLASEIVWTAPQSGTYFVKVTHWNPNVGGCGTSYDLSIKLSGPTGPVGGIAEYPQLEPGPLDASNPSRMPLALAGAVAGGALLLAAGGLLLTRRLRRN
jgi:hypothetical protein